MEAEKTIFVTGATGNQGGAVVRNLLAKGFNVKALTRNTSSAKAKMLQDKNVFLVKGDLSDATTYAKQLEGVDGVFALITFDDGIDKEIKRSIALADAAKQYRVPHFVYSSVIGSDAHTGIPHWESKFVIENHIKSIGLPYTIIRPSSLYENFLIPQVKSRVLKGKLITPAAKETVQQFISAEDVGKISAAIFENPAIHLNKTIVLAAEQMNMEEVAASFSEVMKRKISYGKLPPLLTRLFMGSDLYKMFHWINTHDAIFLKDLEGFKREHPDLLSLKEWIKQHFTHTLIPKPMQN